MKKILSHIFVVLVNFYISLYFVGLVLMILTLILGGINSMVVLGFFLTNLIFCIIYQIFRSKFSFNSYGENVINNIDKTKILKQKKIFSITRIPLFIWIILTLALNVNFLDNLYENEIYSFGSILLFALLIFSIYNGVKYFIFGSDLLPIFLMISVFLFTGFVYKNSFDNSTNDMIYKTYLGMSFIWLILGLIYNKKRIIEKNT